MNNTAPAAVLGLMRERPRELSQDKLDALKTAVAEVRDMEAEKADLEARLKTLSERLNHQYAKALPDLMDEAGVTAITIEPDGNLPSYTATVKSFYSANIAASWDPERRGAGFRYLETVAAGDLSKTEVGIVFPRERHDEARAFCKKLIEDGYGPSYKETVHAATLTAWLKERAEAGEIPDLEKIGGTIGRVVRLKEEKS